MKKIAIFILLFFNFICDAQVKPIKVYVFVAEECPISIFMCSSLKNIAEVYSDKADFILVFPLKTSTLKTANKFKSKNKLQQFAVRMDNQQTFTKQMGATVTPEVVIADSLNEVLYRGRINDAYLEPGKRRHIYNHNDLDNALSLITNGKEVPKPWKQAVGCYITFSRH
ncbi:MAG: hypothetical protein IPI46_06150 [Bacteroidetes bacterium]|nr:hypothetical protein [Bacteroidota bacterium]